MPETWPRTPQDHSKATTYAKRTPADGLIDWTRDTEDIYRLIRAAGRPYPGAFTRLGQHKLTIWRARPAGPIRVAANTRPGTVLELSPPAHALIATGDGALWTTEVQIEGGGALTTLLERGATLE